MELTVIGTGYVGLVTAAVFADFGNQVWGLDIDKKKISSLKSGNIPFFEKGLKEIVWRNLKKKKLFFTSNYNKALAKSEVIFISVGTPAKKNGDYDLSYIYRSAESIAKALKNYCVVCIKSTVPPNTSGEVGKILRRFSVVPFDLASCPEFLREGSAIEDTLHPSRIIIGVESKKAKDLLLKLHKPIKAPKLICDIKSAQMIKYAANAFLATKISFINSIARLSDKVGADIKNVSVGLGLDPRIGGKFLNAGLGYGGSCFPKDTWALIAYAKRLGYNFKFLKEVDNVNEAQIDYFIDKIVKALDGSVKGKIVSVLGLSFKPGTDDMREARSVELIKKLLNLGAKVRVYDPKALDKAKVVFSKKLLKNIHFCDTVYKALEDSFALLLVTEWPEFKKLDFKKAGRLMKRKVVIDGRNIYNSNKLKSLGFIYKGVGRE